MIHPDRTIDATGLRCPLPVLRAQKALGAMAVGSILEIIADDAMAQIDMPHFCQQQGHILLEATAQKQGAHVYLIRRGPDRELSERVEISG
ncbi:MAG: sulfurtransferase TusA family protein [Rhodobacteraceae bacterium]|nr:sulfurtransferase TusA family protein [Paracoccaceae bacterium]